MCHSRIPELATLELAFDLFASGVKSIPKILNELDKRGMCPPTSFDLNGITCMSSQQLNNSRSNIRKARDRLVACLHSQGPPRDGQPLRLWLSDMKRYGEGRDVAASNFELQRFNGNPTLSLPAIYLLRHILYTHNLPLSSVLTLWASFHMLIMRRPLEQQHFISQSTLWSNVQRLHYIDSALVNQKFHPIISQRTPNGFRRYFYSSSDDSEIQNRNRHVLLISTNASNDPFNVQPSYRHVTLSVSAVKSENASKNAKAIVEMLTLPFAAYYGGGTNDNAADAQKEIRCTFDDIMRQCTESLDDEEELLHSMLFENGVHCRPIPYGDPYHVGNLVVTWASIFAFGETEKVDHSQVHHRQVLQSIHSLHAADKNFSQETMNDVMDGAEESVRITTKLERQQRWLVNQ